MTTKKSLIAVALVVALAVGWLGGTESSQPASAGVSYATSAQITSLQREITSMKAQVTDTYNQLNFLMAGSLTDIIYFVQDIQSCIDTNADLQKVDTCLGYYKVPTLSELTPNP